MLKSAWTPAKNPNQQKIREAKALWNVKVSAYIDDFIHLKKLNLNFFIPINFVLYLSY
jgi:hypothetical protein